MNTKFKVIGLTRLAIKSKSTASEADALITRPSELLSWLTTSLSAREILGSILLPVKLDTIASGSPSLRRFCVALALSREDRLATRHALWRNTASIMMIIFDE